MRGGNAPGPLARAQIAAAESDAGPFAAPRPGPSQNGAAGKSPSGASAQAWHAALDEGIACAAAIERICRGWESLAEHRLAWACDRNPHREYPRFRPLAAASKPGEPAPLA